MIKISQRSLGTGRIGFNYTQRYSGLVYRKVATSFSTSSYHQAAKPWSSRFRLRLRDPALSSPASSARAYPSPLWLIVAGTTTVCGCFVYNYIIAPVDDSFSNGRNNIHSYDRLPTVLRGSLRSLQTFTAVIVVIADYKLLFWRNGHLGIESDEYRVLRDEVHRRNAERLLALCRSHGGIYTKAAQHVASLVNMVPKQYTDILSVLQDKAPSRPFEEVCKIFQQEFDGKMPHEFNETPIAAASLAQVHHAITKDGRDCAVKVQYFDVVQNFHLDIWCMAILSRMATQAFPEITLDWIIREFRSNLMHEFDFLNEARQATLTALQFAHKGASFHVPKVYWDLCTSRIMVMEFIRGVKVTDVSRLRSIGIDTKKVAQTLIEVFAEMVFVHGSVHCDPGNILVRFAPGSTESQLVLLDHGLYRHLPPSFRNTYCDLWVSLLTANETMLINTAQQLGVSEAHAKHFPLIFMSQAPGKLLGEEMTPAEKRAHIKQSINRMKLTTKEDNVMATMPVKSTLVTTTTDTMPFDKLVDFLEALPRETLLVIRTGNLIGNVHRVLGGDNLKKFRTQAWYAVWGRNVVSPVCIDVQGTTINKDTQVDGHNNDVQLNANELLLVDMTKRLNGLLIQPSIIMTSSEEQPIFSSETNELELTSLVAVNNETITSITLENVDNVLGRLYTFHYPLRNGTLGWCREWLSVWWRLWIGIGVAKALRIVHYWRTSLLRPRDVKAVTFLSS